MDMIRKILKDCKENRAKSSGQAGRFETQGRTDVAIQVQRPPAAWMRPSHLTEGNLLYSKYTNLNVNLIQKHSDRDI